MRFDDKIRDRLTLTYGMNGRSILQFRAALLSKTYVFETMRSYVSSESNVVFDLYEHLVRLRRSADLMAVPMPELGTLVTEVSEVAVGDRSVRVILGQGGERLVEGSPFDFDRVGRPVRVGLFEVDDSPEFPSTAKHGFRSNWADSATRQGVDEVLLVSSKGEILESNNSNVFAVIEGQIVTPPLDGRQLAGVTRRRLIELALDMGLRVQERRLLVSDHFDEMFLTSSLKAVAPVSSVCGRAMKVGPVTKRLEQGLSALYK